MGGRIYANLSSHGLAKSIVRYVFNDSSWLTGFHGLIFDFEFPNGDFRYHPRSLSGLLLCFSPYHFFSSLFLLKENRYSHSKKGDKCMDLSERRGKVRRPVTGAGIFAVGNLNLNPDRGRSRAVTDPGICIRPSTWKGMTKWSAPCERRHASDVLNLEDIDRRCRSFVSRARRLFWSEEGCDFCACTES